MVLGVGGARVDSGAITVATLVAFLLYVMYLTQPVLQLVNAGTYFQAGRAASRRIGEVTRLAIEDVDPDLPPAPVRDRRRRGVDGVLAAADPAAIAFEDVASPTPAGRPRAGPFLASTCPPAS